ncbi:Pr6Pr family membrane protein [Cellulomonas flavigena]|nr:Pr6Pr family membrane protein [Cellulomonas flavigena]
MARRVDRRRRLALLVCACGSVAVQAGSTDPTWFLRYFSVWCALLSGLTAAAGLVGRAGTAVAWVRDASCTGAMLAGAVYAGVLLPAERLGAAGGGLTWLAPLLLHVTLPVLAVVDAVRVPRAAPPARAVVLSWTLLPAAYLALTLLLHAARGVAPAYTFLDVTRVGPHGVGVAVVVAVGLHLVMADRLVRRLRARPPAPH